VKVKSATGELIMNECAPSSGVVMHESHQ